MTSIAQKCKIDGCNRLGKLHVNGKRYFIKGMCNTHYRRLYSHGTPIRDTQLDYRHAIIDGDIAKIPLGVNAKDGYAIIDKDFAWIDKYHWSNGGHGYPVTRISRYKVITMHKYILGDKDGLDVDHVNRNRADNRLCNLRFVTRQQNIANTTGKGSSSGFKGVFKDKNRWMVRLCHNGNKYYGGRFDDPKEGAKKYNELALKYQGKFAYLNEVG